MHALSVRIFMISIVALTTYLSILPAAGIAQTPVVVSQALPPFSGRVYLPIQARAEAASVEPTQPEVITLPVETPVVATPEPPKKTSARLPMEDDYHSQVTETSTKNACGPTSLLMVLDYYDLKESLAKVIKKARFSPAEGGFDPTCQENLAVQADAVLALLLHFQRQVDRAVLIVDAGVGILFRIELFEVLELIQPQEAELPHLAVVGLAFFEGQFATDDLVARGGVAGEIDAAHEELLAFVGGEGEVDLVAAGELARSDEVSPGVTVEYNDHGDAIGVEILRASRVFAEPVVASLHAKQVGVS